MNAVTCLFSGENVISKVVSASDEKILRIFEPTFNVVKFLEGLSNVHQKFSAENENSHYEKCKIYK